MLRYFPIIALFFGATAFFSCGQEKHAGNVQAVSLDSALYLRGKQLSVLLCSGCHQYPEPEWLDKFSWTHHVMPEMANYYGYYLNQDLNYVPLSAEAVASLAYLGTVPAQPTISQEDWFSMVYFYQHAAPLVGKKPETKPKINNQLPGFQVHFTPTQPIEPGVTLLKILPEGKGFWYADAAFQELRLMKADLSLVRAIRLPGNPVDLHIMGDDLYVLTMGSFVPTNERVGKLYRLPSKASTLAFEKPELVMDSLYRAVHLSSADLNADGRPDLIVSEFGAEIGRLSWLESKGNAQWQHHTISRQPGAINAYPFDFNQDGLTDIVALFGQGREGIYAFINRGNGVFEEQTVLSFPPVYGSTYFELTDMDGDGHPDIVYAAGDHADYPENPPRLRAYHGIRIFKNNGQNQFQEAFFFPMNGAYRVRPGDFNGDGRTDLAAVSYFADYYETPEEGFVLLTGKGNWQFEASSFPQNSEGRWLVMDVGDLQGNGSADIVLGTALAGFNNAPPPLLEKWAANRQALALLLNTRPAQ